MFSLSTRSLRVLDPVHPDLAQVARRAIIETTVDFGVSSGLRTIEEQDELLRQHKAEIRNSLHLVQSDGYAHAIDIFAYINNKATWENRFYGPIVQAFIVAGTALGVQLEFGHLWKSFRGKNSPDSVHIQLNQKYYGGK